MPTPVALLRGINVGGKNLIKMAALKACFEAGGFWDVASYIQRGNVPFEAPERGSHPLTRRVDAELGVGAWGGGAPPPPPTTEPSSWKDPARRVAPTSAAMFG